MIHNASQHAFEGAADVPQWLANGELVVMVREPRSEGILPQALLRFSPAGGEPKGRNPLYGAGDDHVTGAVVGHRPLQLLDRGDLRRCDGHVTPSYITATAGLAVPYTPPVWSRAFDESEEP